MNGPSFYTNRFIKKRPMMVANAVKVLTNEIKKGDAILDIGAGPGVLAGILEGIVQNCFIYGVESNPVFHKNGKELAKRLRRNRYFPVFGDVITNHFNGINPIDVVCFSRSLHELSKDLDERIKVIDKLKKYTKPNAKVIISDPFYITEIHEKPEENAGKISLAREYLQRTLGHSHIP